MNYQHLFYFRTVAALGGITAASQHLRLTPPTLSAQIRALEDTLGTPLFDRTARGMELTSRGRIALRYAEKIFELGAELEHALAAKQTAPIRIGVESSTFVSPLLTRVVDLSRDRTVTCSSASHDELVEALRARTLDVALTRSPLSDDVPGLTSKLVLEAETAFFARTEVAESLRSEFPVSLQGVSFVAPTWTPLRESIERWLAKCGVQLTSSIEVGDAALAAAIAADAAGVLAAPAFAATELERRYHLVRIGVANGVRSHVHAAGSARALDDLLPALGSADEVNGRLGGAFP